jgi:uncharacterized membrane protein (GlpM family)
MELVLRFLIGGLVVTLFAVLGDMLKPKSFAGIFGAAPSVAIATLGLTVLVDGKAYGALEARSMIAGAIAFFAYAALCMRLLAARRLHSTLASSTSLLVWLGCALGGWWLVLR